MDQRSVGVIAFIAICAGAGTYFAQRTTVARGEVLAADLIRANPTLRSLDCDKEIPIGLAGAQFDCRAEFKNGDSVSYTFEMDRAGMIKAVDRGETQSVPKVKKTSDPWGD